MANKSQIKVKEIKYTDVSANNNGEIEISIANYYHIAPSGRYEIEGPYSGEIFRSKWLEPAFKDKNIKRIIIDLNGLRGVGSSFWEEAFAGLMREPKISPEDIYNKLVFKCTDDITLEPEIRGYIEKEALKHKRRKS